jgi:hypothetical protein
MSTLSLRGRVYSLDALRAIMMLLGLVIHTVITYAPENFSGVWDLKAKNTNEIFSIALSWIHLFRMPVFFVAAGFFGALLFFKKGPSAMLKNRVNRILLPLLASLLIIWPLVVFTFVYSMQSIAGNPDALKNATGAILLGYFIPFKLAHLWFLYDLFIYSLLFWAIAMLFRTSNIITDSFNKVNIYLLERPILRIAALFTIFFFCLFLNNTYFLETNVDFVIRINIFFNYLVFYGLGWMIYKCDKLDIMNWNPELQLLAATILFAAGQYIVRSSGIANNLLALQIIFSLSGTLYVFGFVAFFLRYFSSYSPSLSYVMDSAYFVYLIHVPVAALLPGLLTNAGLPLVVEYFATLAGTIAISFAMYHFLVRNTFIGRFLNGKVFRKLQSHPPQEERDMELNPGLK